VTPKRAHAMVIDCVKPITSASAEDQFEPAQPA